VGVCYAAPGSPSSLLNGSSLASTFYYNSRLQPCRISVKSSGTAPTSCTDTTNTGNALDFNYNFNLSASDNGNVIKITNNRDATRSINYGYDNLNRMAYAYTDGNLWGETYQIDPWGNLNKIQAYTGKPQSENLNQMAGPNNQFTGMSYDAAGNLLSDGVSNYVFDGENRITTGAGVTYTYDGNGRRVKKSSGTLCWYGSGPDPLDETDLNGNLTNEYIFFSNKRIARRDSSNNVFYYFADHLGTSRVLVQSGQISPCYDADFYPYGVERTPVVNSCPQNYKFTGKERESESGLDNFGARHDSSNLGRFMSPDPGLFHFEAPQSLNRYVYAMNNPLLFIDPDGKDLLVGYLSDINSLLNIYAQESHNMKMLAFASFSWGSAGTILTPIMLAEEGLGKASRATTGIIGIAVISHEFKQVREMLDKLEELSNQTVSQVVVLIMRTNLFLDDNRASPTDLNNSLAEINDLLDKNAGLGLLGADLRIQLVMLRQRILQKLADEVEEERKKKCAALPAGCGGGGTVDHIPQRN
jgi:RHS repeat-associated protein